MAYRVRAVRALGRGALLLAAIAIGCDDGDQADVGTTSGGNAGQAGVGGGNVGGSAGTDGTGNDGSGGEEGDAGSSGAGGAGGMTGSPCSPEPVVTEDELARAAVVMNSCLADDGYYRTQTYLRGKVGGFSYPGASCFTACLASVGNGCAGFRECFGLSDVEISDACDSCQGNVAIVCGDVEVRWDCGKYGGTCSAGRCIPAGKPECDETTFEDQCDAEGRPLHCDDGLHVGPACSAFGLECQKPSFEAWCVGTGAACSAAEFPYFDVYYAGQSCSGARLNACVRGGLAELDCSLFGQDFSCQANGDAFFCGTASECDPATYVKSCDGVNAVFCNAGKITSVDCTALGFTSCVDGPNLGCE